MKMRAGLVGLCLACLGAGPKIAITEIMYDPRSQEMDDQQTEWVEIRNYGDESIKLQGYQVTSGSKARPHDAKQRFVIGELELAAGEYLLIGVGKPECFAELGLPQMEIYLGETQYAWLTNDGDSVAIRDDKGEVVDEVAYDKDAPWPVISGSGSSIQLVTPPGTDPKEANDHGGNWVASDSTNAKLYKGHGRGTPGEDVRKSVAKAEKSGRGEAATTRPIRARIETRKEKDKK